MMEQITVPADILRPGEFGSETDGRRWEFDFKNEQLVTYNRRVDVLFIGDSVTHLWELGASFRHLGYVVNRGISGDRIQYLRRRFPADAVQLRPRVTVLLIGVNNTWEVCEEGASEQTGEEILRLVTEQYRLVLDMARENGMALIACSVQPVRTGCPGQDLLIRRINGAIRDLCGAYGVRYVDYYRGMVAEDGHTYPERYSADGLHPNAVGYDKMAEILLPVLEDALKEV